MEVEKVKVPGLWACGRIGAGRVLATVRATSSLIARKVAGRQLGVPARELDALLVTPPMVLLRTVRPTSPGPAEAGQLPPAGQPDSGPERAS